MKILWDIWQKKDVFGTVRRRTMDLEDQTLHTQN
jgi:hypothetical protein